MSGPAAILDIDGTLVDSNYQHTIAWYRALRQHDQHVAVWRIHRHIGMGGDQLVASLCGDEVGISQMHVSRLIRRSVDALRDSIVAPMATAA